MTKKKKIIIFSIAGFVLVAAAVLITLFCTVWRPKTTQQWLNDFKSSLAFDIESKNQRTEKKISILESKEEVAKFYQLVEIKEQDGKEVGHIIIEEIYPTLETTEFNVYDEYFFIDSNMYMFRKSGEEEVVTKFASTWDIFWEIANENIGGAIYDFNEDILTEMKLSHEKEISNLSAKITEENKEKFFGEIENLQEISDVSFTMCLHKNLQLDKFEMTYTMQQTQSVSTIIDKTEPQNIEIKDFVKG